MVFLIILSVLFLVFAFYKSSNLFFSGALIFIMWILFAFSSKTADHLIYERRYYNNSIESTEPLFNLLVNLSNKCGLSLQTFIFLMATIFIIVLYWFLSDVNLSIIHKGFVISLYFIYPFSMDLIQLRNTMSFIPILIGIKFLVANKKQSDVMFFFFLTLSVFLHYSGVFYIFLWIVKKINLKQTILVTSITILLISTLSNFKEILIYLASKIGAGSKITTVLSNAIMQQDDTINGTKYMMIITFIISILLLIYVYKKTLNHFVLYVIKLNILLLTIVPLLDYAVDLFRIQRYLLILVYVSLSYYLVKNSDNIYSKYSAKMLLFKIITLLVPICGLYINIVHSGIFTIVFEPIFKNNILFK
ncbi:EpsG family protein [Enterococcus casseliflavus]|uniref:EpsG family protein n=1 Tax=Enterococcus casseliflavus TaxID=37734 RepID=UPI0032E39985